MAAERLSMRQIREILRQKWALGLSHRAVAQSLKVGLGTINPGSPEAARSMARARVVLPTPRPPCKATTSRGLRRLASAVPSRSVAASSGKEKEKVGTSTPMPTFNTQPVGGVCGSMVDQ